MSDETQAFAPVLAATIAVAATATSSIAAFNAAGVSQINSGAANSYQVVNTGTGPIAVKDVQSSSGAAVFPVPGTPGDTVVLQGTKVVLQFTSGQQVYGVSVICPSGGSGNVYITPGAGV